MKHWLATILLATVLPVFAQQPPATPKTPMPQLGTAERVALQSCETRKKDAQKQWQEANQQELSILFEWSTAHPGYHINAQSFAVEADPPKPEVKPALPPQK